MGAKYVFNPLTGNIDTTDVVAFNGKVNLGTAAAPSVFFTGDANTGIYSPGADQVAISTNGTGRLFVDANGNVGVGIVSPSTLFHVEGNSDSTSAGSIALLRVESLGTGTDAGIRFKSEGFTYSQIGVIGGDLYAYANGSERLRITSTGALNFVGAGTAGSTQAVSFNGSAPVDSLVVDSSGRVGLGTSSPSEVLHVQTGNFGSVQIGADGPSQYASKIFNPASTIKLESTASDVILSSARHFIFQDETGSQIGRWDANGRLGIGTTTPSSTFEVNGDAKIGDPSYKVRIAASSSTGVIEFPDANVRSVIRTLGATPLEFEINSSPVARFDTSGRLLIGTSSQSGGSLLQVNDDRIRIASSKTPASASDTGTAGEICWDSSYIYVCTATDTWKRAALSTW